MLWAVGGSGEKKNKENLQTLGPESTPEPRTRQCWPLHNVTWAKHGVFFFLSLLFLFFVEKCKNRWERVAVTEAPVGKAWPTLPGRRKELIQCTTAALCFKAPLMFIHFGIRAKKQTEVCLLRIPNSHNGMLTNNTIMMQEDNRTHTPENSCSNNQFALISINISSQCLQNPASAELKVHRCDFWGLRRLRLQHHKMQLESQSCRPCSPRRSRDASVVSLGCTIYLMVALQWWKQHICIAMNLISKTFYLSAYFRLKMQPQSKKKAWQDGWVSNQISRDLRELFKTMVIILTKQI